MDFGSNVILQKCRRLRQYHLGSVQKLFGLQTVLRFISDIIYMKPLVIHGYKNLSE